MNNIKQNSLDLLSNSDELKLLIKDNPELPILFISKEEKGAHYDSTNMGQLGCKYIKAYLGEILDYKDVPYAYKNEIYTNIADFEIDICDVVMSTDYYEKYNVDKLSEDEFVDLIVSISNKYKKYWKRCIIVELES